MITLQNTTKSVKVLKANGMPILRVIPGFNYVDIKEDELKKYAKTEVNKAVIKESIKLIDVELDEEESAEAKKALETNKKLNKAQRVIDKQNKQILEKDESNSEQAKVIKELTEANSAMTEMMEKMQKQLDKLEKKDKK